MKTMEKLLERYKKQVWNDKNVTFETGLLEEEIFIYRTKKDSQQYRGQY